MSRRHRDIVFVDYDDAQVRARDILKTTGVQLTVEVSLASLDCTHTKQDT